ncbi:MAG TPA: trehalose-phosphatase, partial [Fibrella sp.]
MNTPISYFKRLLIVSYRLPFTVKQTSEGLQLHQNSGGLVSAVLSMAELMGQQTDSATKIHWVGHGDAALRKIDPAALDNEAFVAHPVFLAEADDIEGYAIELASTMRQTAFSIPLTVIQGNKVIEVKAAQHSKGTVALSLFDQKPYDFIVSIGDTTDEDMFRQLPNWAYTIKVGAGASFAR